MYFLETIYHVGELENSIHFIFDKISKTCAIIDPAWQSDLFIKKAQDKGYKITNILLTHWHFDHINATDEIAQKTGAIISIGKKELPYLQLKNKVKLVDEGDEISLGATKIKVINTPGHSAGGVSYLLEKHIIVGDSLFVYGAGHCSLPGGNVEDFFYTMEKLKSMDDNLELLCGHDYGVKKTTNMSEQKSGNAFLLIDNKTDFMQYIKGMGQGVYPYPTQAISKKELSAMLQKV